MANKIPWFVQNEIENIIHEINHTRNLNSLINRTVEEIEEQRFRGDREGVALVYDLNHETLHTLLSLQMDLIRKVTATLQELTDIDPTNDDPKPKERACSTEV